MRAHRRAVSPTAVPNVVIFFIVAGLIFLMTGALGCGPPSIRHEHELAPGRGYHPGLTRVFLVPVNQTEKVPNGLDIADDALNALLERHLESHGLEVETLGVVAYRRAADIAIRRAQKESLSGATGTASGTIAYADVIPRLLEELGSEAQIVVVPNISLRAGEYNGGRLIVWDGVRRREKVAGGYSMTGEGLPVASMHTLIFDREGQQIFSAYGGLDAIFETNIREKRYDLKDDLLQNEEFLAEGICISFHPFFGIEERC